SRLFTHTDQAIAVDCGMFCFVGADQFLPGARPRSVHHGRLALLADQRQPSGGRDPPLWIYLGARLMVNFFSGMITMGFLVAALFFFRFWKQTRDFLFMSFAVSFILLALGQTAGVVSQSYREDEIWIYLFRLA